jgi:hypothetical protein
MATSKNASGKAQRRLRSGGSEGGATSVAALDAYLGTADDDADDFSDGELAAAEALLAEAPAWEVGVETHLIRLYLLRGEREQLEREIAEAVGVAVAAGASWADVGARLGVSRQAASKRYRPCPDESHGQAVAGSGRCPVCGGTS